MVRNVVSVLQEVLHQEQSPIDTPDTIAESSNHVPNEVKTTQHQLAAQLQQTRKMMQATQTQYAAAPHLALIEREDIVKNMTCHPRDPIATVCSAVEELI